MAKLKFWITILFTLLVGLASWSIYSILNQGSSDLLGLFGIKSFYIQNLMIVLLVFILLLLTGKSIKKSIKKIIG